MRKPEVRGINWIDHTQFVQSNDHLTYRSDNLMSSPGLTSIKGVSPVKMAEPCIPDLRMYNHQYEKKNSEQL